MASDQVNMGLKSGGLASAPACFTENSSPVRSKAAGVEFFRSVLDLRHDQLLGRATDVWTAAVYICAAVRFPSKRLVLQHAMLLEQKQKPTLRDPLPSRPQLHSWPS